MKALYGELEGLIQQKSVLYGRFIDLLGEEWRSLSENSLDKMESLLKHKETLLLSIQELNVHRENVVRSIAEAHGRPPEELTLKDIIRLPGNPSAHRLAHHRRVLRSQIDTLNRMNQANRRLIRQTKRTTQQTLEHLLQPGGISSPYGANGDLAAAPMEGRMVRTSA
ncbi:MAG: flagellar protein FlgN [Nitrospinaceae bacterium]